MSTEVFDSVKLSHLKKVVKHVERDLMSIDFSERGIDPDVSFEGYNAAKEEMKNENQISE